MAAVRLRSMEQFSVCLRFVNKQIEAEEVLVGMYNAPDSTAATLTKVIQDITVRLGLDSDKQRAHCFDGAANMSGRLHGVTAEMSHQLPKSLYVQCPNHSLDLVLQETARECDMICSSLLAVKDISNLIRESSKRRGVLVDDEFPIDGAILVDDVDAVHIGRPQQLMSLCPTRWTIRVKAMKRFLENYSRVQKTLATLIENRSSINAESRAKISGYIQKLKGFELLFGLNVGIEVLGPCEHFAMKLQSLTMSASGALASAHVLLATIRDMRTEEEFARILAATTSKAHQCSLNEPLAPRIIRPPKRIEQTDNPKPDTNFSATDHQRKQYFEVVDNICSELERRFDQPDMAHAARVEKVLLGAVSGKKLTQDELEKSMGIHAADFALDNLRYELCSLPKLLESNSTGSTGQQTLLSVKDLLSIQCSAVRTMLSEAENYYASC